MKEKREASNPRLLKNIDPAMILLDCHYKRVLEGYRSEIKLNNLGTKSFEVKPSDIFCIK